MPQETQRQIPLKTSLDRRVSSILEKYTLSAARSMAIMYPSAVYKKKKVSVVAGDAASSAPVRPIRTGFRIPNSATITATVSAITVQDSRPITHGRS